MATDPFDPGDATLIEYVTAQLAKIGPYIAEPEIVQETLGFYRDLWLRLYRLDNDDTSLDFANPS